MNYDLRILNSKIFAGGKCVAESLEIRKVTWELYCNIVNRLYCIYDLDEFQTCEGRMLDPKEHDDLLNLIDKAKLATADDTKIATSIYEWIERLSKRVAFKGDAIVFMNNFHGS